MAKQTLPYGVEGGDPKDQERAASMANEGGAAGASMDTQEQFADTSDQYASAGRRGRLRKKRRMPWMWGAAAASAAIGGVALARTIADRKTRAATTLTEVETETAGGKRRTSKSGGRAGAAASSGRTARDRSSQQGTRARKGKTARSKTQRGRTGTRKTGGSSSRQASER